MDNENLKTASESSAFGAAGGDSGKKEPQKKKIVSSIFDIAEMFAICAAGFHPILQQTEENR